MRKRWFVIPILAIVLLLVGFSLSRWAEASTVFADDFSSGNLSNWSRFYMSSGASQTVTGGIAHFIAPMPTGGSVTNSYVVKDGFVSTVNSTIVASQDILVLKVPNGCIEGNGAIFFLYVCDSGDLAGNLGNVGVGIDGSGVWSLWIGGNTTYVYIFQTSGSPPASNTWYHLVLTIDNSERLVSLAVDGKVVISATQQQFTDRTHSFSLMSGLGEDWWSGSVGPLEIEVDNVRLDVSDADFTLTQNPSAAPTSANRQENTQSLAPTPVQSPAPHPSATSSPSFSQTPTPKAPPTDSVTSQGEGFPIWLAVSVIVAVAACGGVLFMVKGKVHKIRK